MKFHRRWLTATGLALATLGLAVSSVSAAPAGPVGTTPATGTPALVNTGTIQYVRQLVPCGSLMYAVGTITTISQKGVNYTRTGAFSFSATAPYTLTSWAPSINGTVNSIGFVNGDCTNAFIGGTFTTVNGSAVKNIAKISTSTGNVDGYLHLGISGNYVYPGVKNNPTRVYNMQLSHSGTKLLVEGDFNSVGGQSRQQIFMLDLGATSATLNAWNSNEFYVNCHYTEAFFLQDAAWSVDDQSVFVATTGYKPAGSPTNIPRSGLCDAAAAFPATAATVSHTWINYPGCDSLYSVAADATTVYVGGHERWISNPNGCDFKGPGAIDAPGMAGLSTSSGSLTWNPGRGRGLGADDMVITDAGLWIASDNQNNSNMCAGKFGLAGICFLPY